MSDDHGNGLGRARELLRLIVGQTCIHATMAGCRMAAPLLALNEGYSAAAVGVLLALFALTQVFLSLPAGRYADRHGLQAPIRWGIAASCTGAGLAALFPAFGTLCLCALLTGGATGATSIALQRHVGRAAANPMQLRQAFSWLSIGPAGANFLGPLLAGALIDLLGFRVALAAMAVLPLGTWFLIRGARELPPVIAPPGQRRTAAWDLLRHAPFRRLMLMNWVLASAWDVHTFVVPVIGHARGLPASVIGGVLAAFAMAAIGVRLLMPLMAARIREWFVLFVAMALTAVLFGIYPFMQTAIGMGICSMALGLALGSVQPMVMSTLHQITPEHRQGEAIALRLAMINAASVAMPMVFGAGGALVGITPVFWTVGAVVLFGARMALWMRPQVQASE